MSDQTMTYSEFCDKGKQATNLIDELAAYALNTGDRESFEKFLAAKDELKDAGNSASAFIAFERLSKAVP